jgi:hypothetical protein
MDHPAQPPSPPPAVPGYAPSRATVGELAVKRSVLRAALASAASFGIYTFFWFYQYRRRISAELGRQDDAGLHTAGLLVPFLNYYITYLLWRDIGDARLRIGLTDVPALPYVIASIFAGPIVYCIVGSDLNEYWDRRTGGAATDAPWTTGEKLITFLPLACFAGLILLIVLVAVAAG